MQSIVSLLICVIDIDTVFSQHSHDVAVTAPRCDPKCIQTVVVLFVNVDHFVLQH